MKAKTNLAINELSKKLASARNELSRLPFESAQGKVKDVHKGRKIRLEIARLLTKIHEVSYEATD